MSELLQYAKQCYDTSSSKGFWKEGVSLNRGKMVMLMVSELAEAMEADRSDKWYKNTMSYGDYYKAKHQDLQAIQSHQLTDDEVWIHYFPAYVKNTVDDEIADVVIRVLDYIHGWNIIVYKRDYRTKTTGDFANDLLRINWYILLAYHNSESAHIDKEQDNTPMPPPYPGKDWGYVLAAIESLCSWYNIDIHKHIKWKMEYNSNRPNMHGKKY